MAEEFTVDDLKKIIPEIMKGYTGYSGIEVVGVEKGKAVCEIKIGPHHLNPIHGVHGGCLYTLADVVGGFACRSMGNPCITTMNSSISFLNAGLDCEKIIGTGTVVKAGKHTTTVEVDITDDEGKLLTRVISTYFILDRALLKSKD